MSWRHAAGRRPTWRWRSRRCFFVGAYELTSMAAHRWPKAPSCVRAPAAPTPDAENDRRKACPDRNPRGSGRTELKQARGQPDAGV